MQNKAHEGYLLALINLSAAEPKLEAGRLDICFGLKNENSSMVYGLRLRFTSRFILAFIIVC